MLFLLFFCSINHSLNKFSLLPWQFHRHIDLVVDFINLGLAKLLWPQDAVRALYISLLPPHGGSRSGSLIDGTLSRALMASGIYGLRKTDCSCILGHVFGDIQPKNRIDLYHMTPSQPKIRMH